MSSAEELRRRWTDAVVHAPLGALVLRGKDPQRWTQVGRNQLVTAKFLGKLIVDGRRRAAPASAIRRPPGQRLDGPPPPGETAADVPGFDSTSARSDRTAAVAVASTAGTRPTDLGIDGYDLLPASDLLGLLDRLTAKQRAAVRLHESAGRGRQTILHRLDELDAAKPRTAAAGRRASATRR